MLKIMHRAAHRVSKRHSIIMAVMSVMGEISFCSRLLINSKIEIMIYRCGTSSGELSSARTLSSTLKRVVEVSRRVSKFGLVIGYTQWLFVAIISRNGNKNKEIIMSTHEAKLTDIHAA
jgi:hypothetical protein